MSFALKFLSLILSIALLFSLTSCKDTDNVGDISFRDSLGTEVRLKETPKRVAVLFSSFADIWTLAGGEIAITVGETVERGITDDGVILVDMGSGHTVINTETLLHSEPDFVIATADYPVQVDAVELVRRAGIPAALFKVESFQDYLKVLKTFTDILDTGELYRTYGKDLKMDIDEALALSEDLLSDKEASMLFIRTGSSSRSTKAKRGSDHFAAAMLEEMGMYNIANDAPTLLDGLSLEHILISDPDVIFVSFMGDESAARAHIEALLSSDGYSSLRAVREGKVYYLSKDSFHYKPNGNWANAYKSLYEMLSDAYS